MAKKRRGQSAAFMRSINPHLKNKRYKKSNSSNYSMARRKRSSSRRRSSSGMGGIWSNILGVGGYIAFEAFVEPMIPLAEPYLSLAELGAGVYLSKKGGVVGNVAKASIVINSYQLIKYFVGNKLGTASMLPMYN